MIICDDAGVAHRMFQRIREENPQLTPNIGGLLYGFLELLIAKDMHHLQELVSELTTKLVKIFTFAVVAVLFYKHEITVGCFVFLLIRPRPLCPLCLSAHASPSALFVPSVLSACPVRLSARPAPEPPNFIPPISPSALFFLCGMIFPCPISDTLLKSRRGELGISDNNSYLWMQKMSFAHKNTTGYNEKS